MRVRRVGSFAVRDVLRWAFWIAFAVGWLALLSLYRASLIQSQMSRDLRSVQSAQSELTHRLASSSGTGARDSKEFPELKAGGVFPRQLIRYQVVSADHRVLYDSTGASPASSPKWARSALDSDEPTLLQRGAALVLAVPLSETGGGAVLYWFDAGGIMLRLVLGLALGLGLAGTLFVGLMRVDLRRLWKLRGRVITAIVVINLITVGIIFWSLSALQTRELTRRIERESLMESRFATESVVRAFVDFYENSYYERFLPVIRGMIAGSGDLARIRILSVKGGNVLFDSDHDARKLSGSTPVAMEKPNFPASFVRRISSSDQASRVFESGGVRWFSVVNTFRSPGGDPLFRVEFLYTYRSLARNLAAIRRQILLDLIPSLALAILIAVVFAQFLISPIRKLVAALGRVSSGDYTASVAIDTGDEIAELGIAFNSMTGELRRKQELRKYLSNFSYEQITRAVDLVAAKDGAKVPKLGGVRVSATILFCDIRDFVGHCEALEAEEVTSMLNAYFSEMVSVIHKNGGEVDKFIGDAILAVFHPQEGKASESATSLQAIYCALEMRSRLASFNEKRLSSGKRKIEIGIGLSFGKIISGPIGAENRLDFTVIGDVVNVASRIEKLSKQGRHTKILFSHPVEEQIRGLLSYEELAESIRGKSEEVRVYELIGIRELGSLVANLKSEDVKLRARSVEILGQSGNAEALEPVLGALADPDEGVRILAAAAVSRLSMMNDKRSLDALFDRLARENPAPKVASALIACIGKICRGERILSLRPWLDSSDDRIVANTIEAIGQSRTAQGTDLILPKLDSRNHRIKANAAMAAFMAGRFEVINILKPMLMHSDPLMRSSAAFAIGELSHVTDLASLCRTFEENPVQTRQVLSEVQECVPMLVALLKDPEPVVKRQAVIALGKVRDRTTVVPLIGLLESPEILPDVLEALRVIGSHRLVRDVLHKLVT